jgi:hypothetical protein
MQSVCRKLGLTNLRLTASDTFNSARLQNLPRHKYGIQRANKAHNVAVNNGTP